MFDGNYTNLELSLLKYIRDNNDVSFKKELFTENRATVFEIFQNFYKSYQKTPTDISTFELIIRQKSYPPECIVIFNEISTAKYYEKGYLVDTLWTYYKLREIQKSTNEFSTNLNKQDGNFDDALKTYLGKLLSTKSINSRVEKGFIFENVEERWEKYKIQEQSDKKLQGMDTHFHWWNNNCSGAVKKRTYIVYGRPKAGKTTLKFNLGYNIASLEKKHVLFVTGEMPKDKLELVYDSRESMIDCMLLANANLGPSLRLKYKEALKNVFLRKDNFYIVQPSPGFTSEDILSYCYEYEKLTGYPIDLVIIDYIRKMKTLQKHSGDWDKYDYITEELIENVAKPLNVAVVSSTHENRLGVTLKRKGEDRGDDTVSGSDRISANINGLFLIDSFHNTQDPNLINKMRVTCSVNRDGPTFVEDMAYLKDRYYVGEKIINISEIDETIKSTQDTFIDKDFS